MKVLMYVLLLAFTMPTMAMVDTNSIAMSVDVTEAPADIKVPFLSP